MRRDVARTRSMIFKAYLELLFQNEGKKITVNDVIEKADVSRGTFYAHFKDIPDLGEQMEDRIVSVCHELISARPPQEMIINPESAVSACLDIFMQYQDELRIISQNGKSPAILYKLKELIRDSIMQYAEDLFGREQSLILSACVSGAVVDSCIAWIINDEGIDREELVREVSSFISRGMSGL